MNVLCIIPARGGSKRLPGKNLRPVAGKPLLAYSIDHALQSATVRRTVVTTEDAEIAELARSWGAEVVSRPLELAGDASPSESALLHVLDYLKGSDGFVPDIVVFLQCTSPVRDPKDIDNAVGALIDSGADSLFSATESRWLIWSRAHGELNSLNYDFRSRQRDQEHPDEYRENGSLYVFKPWVLRKCNNRLGGKITVYPMGYWSSFQVDTLDDLALIDWIIRAKAITPGRERLPKRPALVVFDFDGVMTDNRVFVIEDGREGVLCSRADGFGIQKLLEAGIPVLVLSSEVNPVVGARCSKLGVPCLQGVSEKWPALFSYLSEQKVDPSKVVFVGNDVNDLECLKMVGYGVAVGDAGRRVRAAAKIVLRESGGRGAVRELCDLLIAGLD